MCTRTPSVPDGLYNVVGLIPNSEVQMRGIQLDSVGKAFVAGVERDVLLWAAGQMRDEGRVSAPARCPRPAFLPRTGHGCLHLAWGGDATARSAFPLVVPTGFEPVSPP
jgi:hypothetical protein